MRPYICYCAILNWVYVHCVENICFSQDIALFYVFAIFLIDKQYNRKAIYNKLQY